jgi:ABC-type Co2+ transport system permease subunit
MAVGHLLVFGAAEAAVTAIAVAYLARTEPELVVKPGAERAAA